MYYILKILFSNLYGKQNILEKQNCNWVRVDKLHLNKEHAMKRSQSPVSWLLNIFAKQFVKSLFFIKSRSKLNFPAELHLNGQLKGQFLLTLHIVPKQKSRLHGSVTVAERWACCREAFPEAVDHARNKKPYTHSKFGLSSNQNSKNHPFFFFFIFSITYCPTKLSIRNQSWDLGAHSLFFFFF